MSGAQYGILDQNDKGKCRSNYSLRPRIFIWMLPIWISHLVLLFTPTISLSALWIMLSPGVMSNSLCLGRKKTKPTALIISICTRSRYESSSFVLPEKHHVALLAWWHHAIPGIQWRRVLRTFCAPLEGIAQPGPALTRFHPSPAMHVAAVFHLFLMSHSGGGNLMHKHLPHHLWFHWRTSLQHFLFVT